jgi:hypothetical protein
VTQGPVQASRPEQRAGARAIVARFLAALFSRTRTSRADVARTIAASDSHVDRTCDPESGRAWQLPDALLLTAEERIAIAGLLAGDAFALVELPPDEIATADDLRDAARVQREAGELIAAHLEALADGLLDAREGAALERAADELVAAALKIRARARQAQRERVIGLRAVTTKGR